MATKTAAPAEVRRMLGDGGELAFLDVREEGVFSDTGHPFFAVSLPLSRLELQIRRLVPRFSTRIVLCDGADGLAERAAARLAQFGYSDLSIMAGGAPGWGKAGFELFTGVNVPSKAFGEVVEERCRTPHIGAAELQRRREAGEDILVVDSRPLPEFRNMSIPGALDCPGAELVYRVPGLVRSPQTLVVVNCAGRTRSIIGAQSLRNARLANPVVALENGTMGWELAGLELARGREEVAPTPAAEGLTQARALAEDVARRFRIARLDEEGLARCRAEAGGRTLYLLDVRSPEEFAAGHLAGSRSAPGGQLVQATDAYIATRNARIVLIDDDGVRAPMTASWLLQMGWPEIYVLEGGLAQRPLVTGAEPSAVLGLDAARPQTIAPGELQDLLGRGEAIVVDLATSLDYERGHIPGAFFAVRSRLETSLAKLPRRGLLVLTSPDALLARLAAAEIAAPARVLDGGTRAWTAAGLPLAAGREAMLDEPDDCWRRPYDPYAAPGARQRYLEWETGLLAQLAREGDLGFRIPE